MPKALARTNAYTEFLNALKVRIRSARISVTRVANKEMASLYWEIGKGIVEKQEKLGWGKAVVERLSRDLMAEFPGTAGFSTRNLWNMKRFYEEYKSDQILQQAVAEIPWGQNLLIMEKVSDLDVRLYYIQATAEMGWSRSGVCPARHPKAHWCCRISFDKQTP